MKTKWSYSNFSQLIRRFLKGRLHRVTLNDQISDWATIRASILLDSPVSPLFIFMYNNDLKMIQ